MALQTQWRFSSSPMSGGLIFQGLDYPAAIAIAPAQGITDIAAALHDLQVMELAALNALNGANSA